jgi:hypothetical protein
VGPAEELGSAGDGDGDGEGLGGQAPAKQGWVCTSPSAAVQALPVPMTGVVIV